MSADGPLLDRTAIEDAFRRLGDRLAKRGVVADLYTFGGTAMALAYDARRATRDIDAVFQPHGIVLDEARAVADELGLPQWWLNEQASVYVAAGGDSELADDREWSEERSLDWHLLHDPARARVQRLVGDLNRVYRATPALWAQDTEPAGFRWIAGDDVANNTVSFVRIAPGRLGSWRGAG